MLQAERALQREVVARLRAAPLDAVLIASPNGIFIPARTASEKALAKRVVAQLKADGSLTPGAPDLVFLWADGAGCVELKRPEVNALFNKHPRGRLSEVQLAFRESCVLRRVRYEICESWPEVRDLLIAWGRLPASYSDPETRIGRPAWYG